MDRHMNDSKRGDNTYVLRCDSYGGSRHYAVCIHIVERVEQKRPRPNEAPCAKACATGECPALKMRREERKAQKSLYFMARENNPIFTDVPASRAPVDVLSPSYQNGWEKAGAMLASARGIERKHAYTSRRVDDNSTPETPIRKAVLETVVRTPTKSKSSASTSTGNLYADLINKMLAEEGAKK